MVNTHYWDSVKSPPLFYATPFTVHIHICQQLSTLFDIPADCPVLIGMALSPDFYKLM